MHVIFFINFFRLLSLKAKVFLRQQGGAVSIIFALSLIPVVGFLGLAIDTGRIYYAHSIITGATDAAALAGARATGGPENMVQQATAIFNANIPQNFEGTISGPSVVIGNNSQTVGVTATCKIDTTFMRLLGKNDISASATSQALISSTGLEVVLALDNTGSMAGGPMAAELQAASKLIDILFRGNNVVQGLWVGLVPFASTVNINMTDFNGKQWLTTQGNKDIKNTDLYPNIPAKPDFSNVGGQWMGCIEARNAPYDMTDDRPSSNVTKFTPFLYPSTLVHKYVHGQPLDRNHPLYSGGGRGSWGGRGPFSGQVGDNHWNLNGTAPSGRYFGDNFFHGNNGVGPNLGCPVPMLPLTAQKNVIQKQIDLMRATYRGGTMINQGLVWAWRMLSPNWQGEWPTSMPTIPQNYGDTQKVIVLMTDGQNQWYDWPEGLPGNPDYSAYPDADYTGYGRLAEGRTGTTSNAAAGSVLNSRMLQACTIIKSHNIVLYTIIFNHGSSVDNATKTLFQSCATDPTKYFYAISDQELVDTFEKIGISINKLRLSWPGKP